MGGEKTSVIPRHVAIIMDGNGRWAKKRFLPRSVGHRAGMERMIALSECLFRHGVSFVTLYALSTENLSRPEAELSALFSLFREYFTQYAGRLAETGIRMTVIGDRSLLPADIAGKIAYGEEKTKNGTRGTLVFAVAYGARQEIVQAANALGGRHVSEEGFSSLLSTRGIPDPDLLIRTGGEMRLSNFLLWQSAYTELYFSKKMFPDFSDRDLLRALKEYARRDRRFGKVGQ